LIIFELFYFNIVGQEWDAIHLYIEKNIYWIKVWIERCIQSNNGRLSWYVNVATLVKESKRKGDTNLKQREIDLSYGLKDKQASIFTYCLVFFNIILMYMA
jgi:hypothetical protein